MARKAKGKESPKQNNGAALGIESKLWEAADELRGSMDAAEYKHIVLGLIFLKYISDAFEARRTAILADPEFGEDFAEDVDVYAMENVFWVPEDARWQLIQQNARQADIGSRIDKAMIAIEKANERLKQTLPKDYANPRVDQRRLGNLVDIISDIGLHEGFDKSRDLLGRTYEYFLNMFASAEGKKGGEFYTPRSIVRVLVEIMEPYSGRIYDPCCGSSGMFVQSERFIEEHGGKLGDISIYGQESNHTTWRLAKMNLAIRGMDANLGERHADSFHDDLHPDLRADFVIANPPFNMSKWGGELLSDDVRWKYGTPPSGNANFAWVQHFIHHLGPKGIAGFVLANGSMSSNSSGEGDIRRAIIEADLVDCMVALPGQLFYGTQIPACLWFLNKDKTAWTRTKGQKKNYRDRRGETLFIDARNLGYLVDRTRRDFRDEDIEKIADTYHAWNDADRFGKDYEDVPGFCKSATLEDIRKHGHVLTPGRYVGAAEVEDDDEPFSEKMARLTKELEEQFAEGRRLEEEIKDSLRGMGFGN